MALVVGHYHPSNLYARRKLTALNWRSHVWTANIRLVADYTQWIANMTQARRGGSSMSDDPSPHTGETHVVWVSRIHSPQSGRISAHHPSAVVSGTIAQVFFAGTNAITSSNEHCSHSDEDEEGTDLERKVGPSVCTRTAGFAQLERDRETSAQRS